ncbi:RPM1-interacting protein 4-like [Momordica charantia]|uniref:RPM1-interacting protein 4-like n=1 Tax=Momordica charantia TaxID=3673 RepID=A0A6J1CND0_MOMCH|nr:RPM1-interacting protein 4-like [Momordica charantia]
MTAKSSSHVPKFGNWDTDDVPYTICFENAGELRAAGVTFDPNDPDTYPPEAFPAANHRSNPSDRRRHHDHHRRPREQPNRDRRSSGSEKLSSERSGSDYSLLKEPGGRRKKINNGVDGISRFPPTAAGHGGNPNPNPRARRNEGEMVASVPKFGSWDARDPKSGDGYTAIFNKVKMEKKIGGSNSSQAVPPLTNQTKQQPIPQIVHGSTSFVSKVCCCLCPK